MSGRKYDFMLCEEASLDKFLADACAKLSTLKINAIDTLVDLIPQVVEHPNHMIKRIYGIRLTELWRRQQGTKSEQASVSKVASAYTKLQKPLLRLSEVKDLQSLQGVLPGQN